MCTIQSVFSVCLVNMKYNASLRMWCKWTFLDTNKKAYGKPNGLRTCLLDNWKCRVFDWYRNLQYGLFRLELSARFVGVHTRWKLKKKKRKENAFVVWVCTSSSRRNPSININARCFGRKRLFAFVFCGLVYAEHGRRLRQGSNRTLGWRLMRPFIYASTKEKEFTKFPLAA